MNNLKSTGTVAAAVNNVANLNPIPCCLTSGNAVDTMGTVLVNPGFTTWLQRIRVGDHITSIHETLPFDAARTSLAEPYTGDSTIQTEMCRQATRTNIDLLTATKESFAEELNRVIGTHMSQLDVEAMVVRSSHPLNGAYAWQLTFRNKLPIQLRSRSHLLQPAPYAKALIEVQMIYVKASSPIVGQFRIQAAGALDPSSWCEWDATADQVKKVLVSRRRFHQMSTGGDGYGWYVTFISQAEPLNDGDPQGSRLENHEVVDSGSFHLIFGESKTATLPYNADEALIESELEKLTLHSVFAGKLKSD